MRNVRFALLGLAIFFMLIFISPGFGVSPEEYYPGADWRTSTPEEQGIDSGKLAAMFRDIERNNIEINSVLIIRHGYLVAEGYRDPFNRDTGYNVKSVCKSFLSALTGIAIREKYIRSIDQKVSDFLPEYFKGNPDPRKNEITVRHLLTMTAGLQSVDSDISRWAHSTDWLKYVIAQPVTAAPGTSFNYNTGLTHLMSGILAKASGMSTWDFGRKYLFDPLGISVQKWLTDPQGVVIGGAELFITPRDMAKFGYLYLQHGRWKGQQIVPGEWVDASTRNQLQAAADGNGYGYGYWWWPTRNDYQARGWGGQYIIVNPQLDLVVVLTAADFDKPLEFLHSYIYPAVAADGPLKANPGALVELQNVIDALANPKAGLVDPSPGMMKAVNGKTYHFGSNPFGLHSCVLSFQGTDCTVRFDQMEYTIPVGPDGKFRIASWELRPTYFGERPLVPVSEPGGTDRYQSAMRGRWLDAHTFLFEWLNYLGEPVKYSARFVFHGRKLTITTDFRPEQWGGPYILQGRQ